MTKVYKKGIWYYSKKKGIHGLMLGGNRNAGWKTNFYVMEASTPDRRYPNRKIVKKGTLTECRQYMRDRFRS